MRRALEQFTWTVRSQVTGLMSPVVLGPIPSCGMLSFVAVIAVAWLLYVHRMEG
ncbi:MAG: hypothetical protein C0P67_007680 [Bacillota bacterium]